MLGRGSLTSHLILATAKCRVWWEYVESAANWSDKLSREMQPDQWMVDEAFEFSQCVVPLEPWHPDPASRLQRVAALTGTALG